MGSRLKIGVSTCLLGEPVRYDGRGRRNDLVIEILSPRFELIPVCPEVEAGLGVPRPPVQLVGDPLWPRARGVEERWLDVTAELECFSAIRVKTFSHLSGFLFKARSPSCGLDVPIYDQDGRETGRGRGIFVRILKEHYPLLPVIDEEGFSDPGRRNRFLQQLPHYQPPAG